MKIEVELKDQIIIDCLDSVPNYEWWGGIDLEIPQDQPPTGKSCWELLFSKELDRVFVIEDDDGEEVKHPVNLDRIERGLKIMSASFPRVLARIVEENSDGNDADLLLQCIVFGEEKYA